jgi:hypothetical protein
MAPPSVSRGRKRRRGREEEGGSFRQSDLGAREPKQSGIHCQRGLTQEPGAPFLFLSPFKFPLLFVCAWSIALLYTPDS